MLSGFMNKLLGRIKVGNTKTNDISNFEKPKVGEKIAEIVEDVESYVPKAGEYLFEVYCGDIPIIIKSRFTKEQFDFLCK